MAVRTRVLQLAIAVVNLSLIGLAFTSIWPFPHGDFKVHLPTAKDVTWTYENGLVVVSAPYTVDNGGYYDVDNLTIRYSVTNNSHYQLAGDTIHISKISKGSSYRGSLSFSFNLLGFYENGTQWMIFNDDIVNFDIHVSCYYTMKLVKFEASYVAGKTWDALIKSWDVHLVPPAVPTAVEYWLNTSSLLAGLPPAHLNMSITRDGVLLGSESLGIQLGGDYHDNVSLSTIPSFNPTIPGNYTLTIQPSVLQYPLTTYSWSWTYPPLGGLP